MAMIDPAMASKEHAACQLKRGVLLRNRLNFRRDCANFLMSGSRTMSHEGTKGSSCLRRLVSLRGHVDRHRRAQPGHGDMLVVGDLEGDLVRSRCELRVETIVAFSEVDPGWGALDDFSSGSQAVDIDAEVVVAHAGTDGSDGIRGHW